MVMSKKMVLVLVVLAAIGLSSAQSRHAARQGTEVSISNVAQLFATYWDARQPDKVLALYAPDFEFLSEQGRISGKPALEKFFKQMAQMFQSSRMSVHTVSQSVSGDLAYVTGDYSEDLVLKDGLRKAKGAYVVVLKRVNGKWLIEQHIWTDEMQHP
jgi:uncharacterized protein (TIGR02246 family)